MQPSVDVKEAFITTSEELLAYFLENVQWECSMKSRETASYGVPYNYSHIKYRKKDFCPKLVEIKLRIENEFGYEFNSCLLNLYLNGDHSMGFHSDHVEDLNINTKIVILSLGCERDLEFQHKTKGDVVVFNLPSGSLLQMDQETQLYWNHGIKQSDEEKPRISLTWRSFKTG